MNHKYEHCVFVDPLGNHGHMKLHSADLLLDFSPTGSFLSGPQFPHL